MSRRTTVLLAIGAVVAVVGFLLFRPDTLFRDDVVEESLEDAFADPSGVSTTAPGPPTTTSAVPVETTETEVEATPSTAPAPEPAPPTTADTPETTTTTTTTTTTPAPPTTSAEPVAIAGGGFVGIDHSASGTATVYERAGEFVLRFEDDTDIQNGPDLYVWIIEDEEYRSGDPGAFLDLGTLKGNVGGQNYQLPDEYDPDVHRAVLIWCLRFGVPFALAPITS